MNFKLLVSLTVVLGQVHCQLNVSDEVLNHIEASGFKGEAHQVQTSDGYRLKVHRIIARSTGSDKRKVPVFLMHGLSATSGDFIVAGSNIALAYLLSSSGYDVWLGNARGNKYSMSHASLSSESNEFWQFSWHEIGHYDLAAMIDYMLKVTESTQTFYVGHSQGTTALVVLLSTRPEYNQKILQAHLMAPAVYMGNVAHPFLKYLRNDIELLDDYAYLNLEVFWSLSNKIYANFCRYDDKSLCSKIMFAIFGPNKNGLEIDTHILPVLNWFVSPRISVKQVQHFIQSINSGRFQMFDYQAGNVRVYNSSSPPEYNLENVAAEVSLYQAAEDLVISRIDVEQLKNVLPNVRRYRTIPNWNHVDFVYGKNARKILYEQILRSFETQN